VKAYFALNGQILYWTLLAPFRGQFFKLVKSSPDGPDRRPGAAMASLTSFSIGLTLAMQAAGQLKRMAPRLSCRTS